VLGVLRQCEHLHGTREYKIRRAAIPYVSALCKAIELVAAAANAKSLRRHIAALNHPPGVALLSDRFGCSWAASDAMDVTRKLRLFWSFGDLKTRFNVDRKVVIGSNLIQLVGVTSSVTTSLKVSQWHGSIGNHFYIYATDMIRQAAMKAQQMWKTSDCIGSSQIQFLG
jgi:hypothetical protein